jgi:hypothetical protein
LLGRPLGERSGLAPGLASLLAESGAGLIEFASEAVVLPPEGLVLLIDEPDLSTELPHIFQDGEG